MNSNKEWSNPNNPFNSYKVLWHREHLEGCISRKLLPPVQADTNPTNICNFNCVWCNSKEFRTREPIGLSKEHLLKLADIYKDWGIKSTCVAGGGEPLTNKATYEFIEKTNANGIEVGLITNGSLMKNHESLKTNCKWIGFSMDSGTREAFNRLKGVPPEMFDKALNNMYELAKKDGKARVCYKFLIHPINQKTILEAVKKAKDSGAVDVHIRPVGYVNLYPGWKNEKLEFDHAEINHQIEEAFKLEDKDFHLYGVKHKFNPDFSQKNDFDKCYCAPLLATFCADGWCYVCFDRRGRERMCKHFDIKEFWGSEKHIKMLEDINPKECPRCTYGPHNKMAEAIKNDDFCINFP